MVADEVVVVVVGGGAGEKGGLRERFVRRVSCRPGAEGAPFVKVCWVLEVVVGCFEDGAMRRD